MCGNTTTDKSRGRVPDLNRPNECSKIKPLTKRRNKKECWRRRWAVKLKCVSDSPCSNQRFTIRVETSPFIWNSRRMAARLRARWKWAVSSSKIACKTDRTLNDGIWTSSCISLFYKGDTRSSAEELPGFVGQRGGFTWCALIDSTSGIPAASEKLCCWLQANLRIFRSESISYSVLHHWDPSAEFYFGFPRIRK